MRELLNWIEVGLVLGGIAVALGGMVWKRTVNLARAFGREIGPDRGLLVMLIGFVMVGVGLAMIYYKI